MDVGPLFDNDSLSLFLEFRNPTLVSPLSSDPLAYESSFRPFPGSILFSQIPPTRTHVNALLGLTVSNVPEPASLFLLGAGTGGLFVQSRRRAMQQSKPEGGAEPDLGSRTSGLSLGRSLSERAARWMAESQRQATLIVSRATFPTGS